MSLSSFDSDGQGEMWIASEQIARSPGHPFYAKLNQVLREEEFDRRLEELCAPYYQDGGRPSIPLGQYVRMLLIGYFEGIDSQRGIAWRCADSLSLREFLGLALTDSAPHHSSLTRIRQRLPLEVHERMFAMVLEIGQKRGVLRGKTLLVDSTTLEANAAMRSIVRQDTDEDWTAYLKRLAGADGIEEPTAEDMARYDQKRTGKKVSNEDWRSKTDPDARIAKMKEGTTYLAYKAEHAVDLESGMIVASATRDTTKSRRWNRSRSGTFERACRRRRNAESETGAATRPRRSRPTRPTGAGRRASEDDSCCAGAANWPTGPLRMSAKPEAGGGAGFAGPRKSRSITTCAPSRSTWVS